MFIKLKNARLTHLFCIHLCGIYYCFYYIVNLRIFNFYCRIVLSLKDGKVRSVLLVDIARGGGCNGLEMSLR